MTPTTLSIQTTAGNLGSKARKAALLLTLVAGQVACQFANAAYPCSDVILDVGFHGERGVLRSERVPGIFSPAPSVLLPGDDGTLSFPIRTFGPCSVPIVVQYTTIDDTAKAYTSTITPQGITISTGDYLGKFGSVTIPAGQTTAYIKIRVLHDTLSEGNERFKVRLLRSAQSEIRFGEASGWILDDDPPRFNTLTRSSYASEGQQLRFKVRLSAPVPHIATVFYRTVDMTAKAGVHYQYKQGTLVFPAGDDKERDVVVNTFHTNVNDLADYGMLLHLSNATGAPIGWADTVGTILEVDIPDIH